MGSRLITYVTPEIEAEPRSGGELRSLRLLEGLARRAPVTVVVVGPMRDRQALAERIGGPVRVFDRPASAVAKRVGMLARRWPLDAARSWSPAAGRLVAARAEAGDVCVLDHLRMAVYRPPVGRYVVSLHNVESGLLADMHAAGLRRLDQRWSVWAARRLEQRLLGDARGDVVVVSTQDARALGPRCVVVPNGADLPEAVPPLDQSAGLLFVGSLGYAPNVEALRWWCEQVWPLLPSGTPPLTVVGRGVPAPDLLRAPGLDVVGEVVDVGTYLASAAVVVVPLQAGGGTRLKVLEAFAWGRPVVSTSKGVEGHPVRAGRELLIADAPADFAAAVVRLRSDALLARSLTQEALRFVRAHDWVSVADRFANLVLSGSAR